MSGTLIIRWHKFDEAGPQIEFLMTNGFDHPVMLLGVVLLVERERFPLALEAVAEGRAGYGEDFYLEPYQSARCRPIYDPQLADALTYEDPIFCFLAHEPWPVEVMPIEMHLQAGNWLDKHALSQLRRGSA